MIPGKQNSISLGFFFRHRGSALLSEVTAHSVGRPVWKHYALVTANGPCQGLLVHSQPKAADPGKAKNVALQAERGGLPGS